MRIQESNEELWRRYHRGDDSAYSDLVERYLPLVETIARTMKARLPAHIDMDDLISDGYIGLMEAVKRFNNSQGYRFETYASLRIRGEMLDKLRSSDWAPRTLRLKYKSVDRATDALVAENNMMPSRQDLADYLGWSLREVDEVVSASLSTFMYHMDENVSDDGQFVALSDILADHSNDFDALDWVDVSLRIVNAISLLSDKYRVVLQAFYGSDLSLREVAESLGVSESKAAMLQSEALAALQDLCIPV